MKDFIMHDLKYIQQYYEGEYIQTWKMNGYIFDQIYTSTIKSPPAVQKKTQTQSVDTI